MHLLFIVKEVDNEPQGILLISSVLKQMASASARASARRWI
jgi:hypothetical protein